MVLHIKNGTSLYGLSIKLAKAVARCLGRKVKPENYRSRRWHQRAIERCGGRIADFDSFGILTFVPLPPGIVRRLLTIELKLLKGNHLRKYGVNFQATIALTAKEVVH